MTGVCYFADIFVLTNISVVAISKSFLSKNAILVILLVLLAGIFGYLNTVTDYVEERGVITVAKATKCLGPAGGTELYFDIYLAGKVYATKVGTACVGADLGKYFFVKVYPGNPTISPVFYHDKEVPQCILDTIKYYPGWKEIPVCR